MKSKKPNEKKEKDADENFRAKAYEATNIETLVLKYGGVKELREELERIYPTEFVSRDVLINMENALDSAGKVINELAEYSEEPAITDLAEYSDVLNRLQHRLMGKLYHQHDVDKD